jgi:YD repeat-containing protein
MLVFWAASQAPAQVNTGKTGVTDQASNTVQYTYDAANQLQTVVQLNSPTPAQNTTSYVYDVDGNLTNLTDANGHTTQRGFNLLDQWITDILPSAAQSVETVSVTTFSVV